MGEELKLEVGTEEFTSLKPAVVKIVSIAIEEYGEQKSKKVICLCKHPNKEELIKVSSIKFENKGKLETVGLWLNKDSKGLIRKGSALAIFLSFANSKTIDGILTKDINTCTDERGYLCFKAY